MATELTVQSERAFQKQPHIFLNSKTKVKTARPGKNGRRWVRGDDAFRITFRLSVEDVFLLTRVSKTAVQERWSGFPDAQDRH